MTGNLFNSPDNLSNEHLNELGKRYPKNEGFVASLFPLHTNQPLASLLARYNEDNLPYYKWLYLVSIYQQLPKNKGILGDAIRALFHDAFGEIVAIEVPTSIASQFMGNPQMIELPVSIVAKVLKGMVTNHYAEVFLNMLRDKRQSKIMRQDHDITIEDLVDTSLEVGRLTGFTERR